MSNRTAISPNVRQVRCTNQNASKKQYYDNLSDVEVHTHHQKFEEGALSCSFGNTGLCTDVTSQERLPPAGVGSAAYFPHALQASLSHPTLRMWHSLPAAPSVRIAPEALIYPVFVAAEPDAIEPIPALPGISRFGVNMLTDMLMPLVQRGLRAVLLFGPPPLDRGKDSFGSSSADPKAPVAAALSRLRKELPALLLIADVCLCAYTLHGHCGVPASASLAALEEFNSVKNITREPSKCGQKNFDAIAAKEDCKENATQHFHRSRRDQKPAFNIGCPYLHAVSAKQAAENIRIQNALAAASNDGCFDLFATNQQLARTALLYAHSGAHVLAPSDMFDGRVLAIRQALKANGYSHRPVMSYSAKFASCLYGPFRAATDCALQPGADRRSYQLPPPSASLAMRALDRDVAEGAEVLIVKPASLYLDVVSSAARAHPNIPIAAYQVSGEYAMIHHAANAGVFDLRRAVLESVTAIQRAGARIVITYFAPAILDWISDPGSDSIFEF